MPSIPASRREQAPPPPAQRNQWRCLVAGCGAKGYGQNAQASSIAMHRHISTDHPSSPPGQENTP